MVRIERILCPIDFSDFSQHAFEEAATLASWYKAEIVLLHAYRTPVGVVGPAGEFAFAAGAGHASSIWKESMHDTMRHFAALAPAGVGVRSVIVEAPAVDAIVSYAEAMKADLVVIGTHGRSGVTRLVLGSVTERLLHKAPCPVLTVPRRALGTTRRFARILCPIDFSDASLEGLRYALSLAEEANARLVVAHVLEATPAPDNTSAEAARRTAHIRADLEAQARRDIAAAIPANAATYCAVREVIVSGAAPTAVLHLADEYGADLIVIGVRCRAPADVMIFGSTSQQVVRQATCPVLTVRHPCSRPPC